MGWNPAEIDSQILAVHAALVPNGPQGEVVLFGGDEHWADQQESAGNGSWQKTRVYDVASHSIVAGQVQSPTSDVFCSHHVFIGDGRLLIAGGTSEWPEGGDGHHHTLDFLGHSRCWLYSPRQRKWTETTRLNRNPDQPDEARSGGRWYPGLVALGDGSAIAFYGHLDRNDYRHRNIVPERYLPSRAGWVLLPNELGNYGEPASGGRRFLFFVRGYTLPNGKIFSATPLPTGFATATPAGSDGAHFSTAFDPGSGTFVAPQTAAADGVDGDWNYPSVLLPLLPVDGRYNARILYWEGAQPKVLDTDAATLAWTNTGPRAGAVAGRQRQYGNAVLLPTGQVCMVGGVATVDPEDGVNQAELYTPDIDWATGAYGTGSGTWSLEAGNAIHTRNYHSTALLLPNGKVWVAGGNIDAHSGDPATVGNRSIELYEPPYIGIANRIVIQNSPRMATYGQGFDILLDRAATNVGRIALIRNGSVTHATDNDQRYVGLAITARSGNRVTVAAPPNGNVAPPGYYMLWAVDTAGNPCTAAPFVRLGHVNCRVIADRSTFSEEEVQALGGGASAVFAGALYVDFDGFIASELVGTPTGTLSYTGGGAVPASDMRLQFAGRFNEIDPPDPDVPTRVTFAFDLIFDTMGAFSGWLEGRGVTARFELGTMSCDARLQLTKSPNPYMIDIDPVAHNEAWLSTDVRVFKARPGQSRFGVPLGFAGNGPTDYIRQVVDRLRSGTLSFAALPTQGDDATLDGAYLSGWPPMPTCNFAVARVRYRATATTAQDVRCFFRLCNVAATGLEYDPSTVYRSTGGANPVPLLGLAGGQVVSIPFVNAPRVQTIAGQAGAASMATQPLDPNYDVQDIVPVSSGAEVTAYFGCYLDINTPAKRFPAAPGDDGPFAESSSLPVRDLLRSWHNCLVAEIVFAGDPTVVGSTPSNSDNLSQRNLAIIGLENPGAPASRTAMHTIEIAPSRFPQGSALFDATDPARSSARAARGKRPYPDELFFNWHNCPPETRVTLYFSDLDTAGLAPLLQSRISAPAFEVLDEHTLRFRVGDCAWLPLPGGREIRIPALVAIQLPDGIVEGQTYRVTIRQVSGLTSTIIGSVTIEMPVTKSDFLRFETERQLSFMGHILGTLPSNDRWRPLHTRLVQHLAAKVDALGGRSRDIHPNPDGSGLPYDPIDWKAGDDLPADGFGSGGSSGGGAPTPWWPGWLSCAGVGALLLLLLILVLLLIILWLLS